MTEVYHETVLFNGRVQGVGFRYSTLQAAKEFEVTGWVKNLSDGRVEMEVEGEEREVTAFVHAVEARMHGFIRKTERKSGLRSPSFQGFQIR